MILKSFRFKFSAAMVLSLFLVLSTQALSQRIDELPEVKPGAVGARDPIFHDEASRGIQLVFHGRYEEALAIFNELLQRHPDHP